VQKSIQYRVDPIHDWSNDCVCLSKVAKSLEMRFTFKSQGYRHTSTCSTVFVNLKRVFFDSLKTAAASSAIAANIVNLSERYS